MHRLLTVLVVIALLAMPSAASARSDATNAPPGNSAIDEYLETVPGATGNRAPGQAGDGGLTAAQRARLERQGADGKALADAIDATAPKRTKPAADLTGTGRAPIGSVLDIAAGRDGGMGLLLPAILLIVLLGAITLAVLRRRSAS